MTDQQALSDYINGDQGALGTIYEKYRAYFIAWLVKRYRCSTVQAIEAYQEAIVILAENVWKGKIKEVRSSLESYLFEIGKRKWLQENRHHQRFVDGLDTFLQETNPAENPWETEDKTEILTRVFAALETLGDPCKQNLTLFFLEGKSDKELALLANYKNTDTSKTMRYKCLERLRKLLFIKKNDRWT